MKCLIVIAALCAIVQGTTSDASILSNKALLEDIEAAKSAVQALGAATRTIVREELTMIPYLNDGGQSEVFELYAKLLRAQVLEADVKDLRNKTDTQAYEMSANILDSAQNPRDLWAASSLSFHHLENFSLSLLEEDIITIKAEEREVWFDMIGIEDQLQEQQREFQANVEALITGLSGAELSEIQNILDTMRSTVEIYIENLRNVRIQLVDYTNIAIEALQKIVDQIPGKYSL